MFRETTNIHFLGGVFFLIFCEIFGRLYRNSRQGKDNFGSAHFATSREIRNAGLFSSSGVVLGQTKNGKLFRHDGQEHVKVIAPTRSGKGVGCVIPTLLSWEESVIVLDIKGENFEKTSGFRGKFSNVIYFNPTVEGSAHFNPLFEVRRGENEIRDVQNIAEMIMDPDGMGMSNHWERTGHSLLVGVILHVLYAEKNKTLEGIANFLSDPGRTLEQSLDYMLTASHFGSGKTHPVVASAARDMLNKADNERSGVLSTAISRLSLYRDKIIAKNTRDSDFRIQDLMQAEAPLSLYLIFPPSDISRLKPLFRLVINQICCRLTEKLTPKNDRHKLLLLIDEFPALGRLNFFEDSLGFIAQYGIKAMLISQSIKQLNKHYGRDNSILDNCHIRLFYAPNTIETAEIISKMLGQKTAKRAHESYSGNKVSLFLKNISVSEQRNPRYLLTPDEVLKLASDKELIFTAGNSPILSRKIRYYADSRFTPLLFPKLKVSPKRPYSYRPKPRGHDWEMVNEESKSEIKVKSRRRKPVRVKRGGIKWT